ncbi:MAG: glutamine amidotransferase-related protein, partial [Saezia sp.]
MAHIILLDNLGSFTHNIADQIKSLQHDVQIYRNTAPVTLIEKQLSALNNPVLVLTPGPSSAHTAGCMPDLLKRCIGKVPIIGICLGHQAIIENYGGTVQNANEIVHGKTSQMHHDGQAMFAGLSSPLT